MHTRSLKNETVKKRKFFTNIFHFLSMIFICIVFFLMHKKNDEHKEIKYLSKGLTLKACNFTKMNPFTGFY